MSWSDKKVTLLKIGDSSPFYQSQQENEKTISWIIDPETPFYLFIRVLENSFIVWWIIDKIATNADSWFVPFTEEQIAWYETWKVEHLQHLLNTFDVKHAITNIASCGNYWLEVSGWKDKSIPWNIWLHPFLTHECAYKDDRTLVQKNSRGNKEFAKESYIHFKTASLKTRYYGESIFSKCVRQIVVLEAIDKYYERFFDYGMINTKLLMDINGELWEDSIKIIQETIKDRLRWDDNSFTTAIVPTELKQLDLENQVDIKWLLQYRIDLMKAIAIWLNMPYDLLNTDNSNRATSEVSSEHFNKHIVKPLQQQFVKQLQKGLYPYFWDLVNHIQLTDIDTKNQLEEMQILTWYKTAWIFTANMVLEQLGRDSIVWGDVLETSSSSLPNADEQNSINAINKQLNDTYAWSLLWNNHINHD